MPKFKQLNFFHLCSDVIIEEGTKKTTIIGDFNQLKRKQAESDAPFLFSFVAILNFSGHEGLYKVKLEIRDPKDVNILDGLDDTETRIDEARTTVIWKLAAVFRESGTYNVIVRIDDAKVFAMPFHVMNA